jgi:hypothetical protein
MTDPHPVQVTNLDRYGSAELPWSRARDLLAVGPPGPPPWQLYRFNLHTAFGVATAEPHGATRWRFGGRWTGNGSGAT